MLACSKSTAKLFNSINVFSSFICVLLLIVGCCGVTNAGSAKTTMFGASWAYAEQGNSDVFLSFWGVCAASNYFDNQGADTDFDCRPWSDVCTPGNANVGGIGGLLDRACRTGELEHFLGFAIVSGFFVTLFFFVTMILRLVKDSKARKTASIVSGSVACLLIVLAFGTYNDQCFPSSTRTTISIFGANLNFDIGFKIGPAFGATIAAFVFMFLNLVSAILVPHTFPIKQSEIPDITKPYAQKGQVASYV